MSRTGRLDEATDDCVVFGVVNPDGSVASGAWRTDVDAATILRGFHAEHPDPDGVHKSTLIRVRDGATVAAGTWSGLVSEGDLASSLEVFGDDENLDRVTQSHSARMRRLRHVPLRVTWTRLHGPPRWRLPRPLLSVSVRERRVKVGIGWNLTAYVASVRHDPRDAPAR